MHAGFEVVVALFASRSRVRLLLCARFEEAVALSKTLEQNRSRRLSSSRTPQPHRIFAPSRPIHTQQSPPNPLRLHQLPPLVSETGFRRLLVLLTGNIPLSFHTTFPDAFHYQGHLLDIDNDEEEEVLSKVADQPQGVQAECRHHLKLLARHRLFNKMVKETDRKRSHIMSSPMQELFLGIVRYGLRSWTDGAYGLRHALLGLCDEWDLISDGADYPIAFSEEEIELHCEVLEKGESRAQRRILLCEEAGCNPGGGVKSEAYDEVKAKAEALRKKWSPEELGPWPLQDGASTSLL